MLNQYEIAELYSSIHEAENLLIEMVDFSFSKPTIQGIKDKAVYFRKKHIEIVHNYPNKVFMHMLRKHLTQGYDSTMMRLSHGEGHVITYPAGKLKSKKEFLAMMQNSFFILKDELTALRNCFNELD